MIHRLLLAGALIGTAVGLQEAPRVALGASEPRAEGTLERLADGIVADARAQGAEAPVAVHVTATTDPLRRAFATALAGRFSAAGLGGSVLEAHTPEEAESRSRASGARTLVRVSLAVEQGQLAARGDVLGTWVNFWSGRQPVRPARPAGVIARSLDADPASLSLAAVKPSPGTTPAPAAVQLLVGTLARVPSRTAALAAGDLDRDGKDEVVALTADQVWVFGAAGPVLARYELSDLPTSPTPCREPFGAVAVLPSPAPRVAAFSARHARGVELSLDRKQGVLQVLGPLDTPVIGPGVRAAFNDGRTSFKPELRLGNASRWSAPGPFVTASLASSSSRSLLVFPDGSATLLERLGGTDSATRMIGLGAASALSDLNGDGAAELLTTSAEPDPTPDTLRVLTLPNSGAPPDVLWQGTLPRGRALQLAAADLDGDGRREVVVAVWLPDGTSELFLFREVAR